MILLSPILILLSGVFRAIHTIRKDKPEENIFLVLTYTKGEKFNKWYWGGNRFYSPSWPWSADFWHFFVFMQIYAFTGAAISAAYWPCNWWGVRRCHVRRGMGIFILLSLLVPPETRREFPTFYFKDAHIQKLSQEVTVCKRF